MASNEGQEKCSQCKIQFSVNQIALCKECTRTLSIHSSSIKQSNSRKSKKRQPSNSAATKRNAPSKSITIETSPHFDVRTFKNMNCIF